MGASARSPAFSWVHCPRPTQFRPLYSRRLRRLYSHCPSVRTDTDRLTRDRQTRLARQPFFQNPAKSWEFTGGQTELCANFARSGSLQNCFKLEVFKNMHERSAVRAEYTDNFCYCIINNKLDGQGKARREAARHRKSEWKVNVVIPNSSRSNGSLQITPKTVSLSIVEPRGIWTCVSLQCTSTSGGSICAL